MEKKRKMHNLATQRPTYRKATHTNYQMPFQHHIANLRSVILPNTLVSWQEWRASIIVILNILKNITSTNVHKCQEINKPISQNSDYKHAFNIRIRLLMLWCSTILNYAVFLVNSKLESIYGCHFVPHVIRIFLRALLFVHGTS